MYRSKIIEGVCPYCGSKNSIYFCDYHYGNNKIPYATDVPVCSECGADEIEIRKINNRRFKVIGKW